MILKELMPVMQEVFLTEAKKHNKPYIKKELLNASVYSLFTFSDTKQGHEFWANLCRLSFQLQAETFKYNDTNI
jgi:hypothetical protein